MKLRIDPPITARKGGKVKVVIDCRVSDPDDIDGPAKRKKRGRKKKQTIQSNADQAATFKQWIEDRTDLPCEFLVISGTGSGERLDRDELELIENLVSAGDIDIVIAEDLGRICRRVQALIFCEFCEDYDTRVIAPNDQVDTGVEGWRLAAFFAVMRHETYNVDGAKRIRRSLRNRFVNGGICQTFPPGYIKPEPEDDEEVKDSDVRKDPNWESVYDTWFTMLDDGASYSEVGDWLNAQGLKTSRGNRWTCSSVSGVTRNTILKGLRRRNDRKSRRVNMTGRRKSVKADPSELLTRECPHLAFIAPERYDRVLAMLQVRNSKFARKKVNGVDPRQNKPRKRTDWPGDHAVCGICGRPLVYGGNGQRSHLICSGAKAYTCWSGVTFDGPFGGQNILGAIVDKIETLPGFDEELMTNMAASLATAQRNREEATRSLGQRRKALEAQRDRIVDAIAASGGSPSLLAKLKEIEADVELLEQERIAAERELPELDTELPSIDLVKERAREIFTQRAFSDPAFQRQLKIFIPKIEVHPYKLLDDCKPVLRARVCVNLVPLVWDEARGFELPVLQHELVVDLFDPPQRAAFRERVIELNRSMTLKAAADKIGITATAAQRAAALHREMLAAGRTDPYLPIREPSSELSRMRRHLHSRFRFEPLPGYEAPKFPSE